MKEDVAIPPSEASVARLTRALAKGEEDAFREFYDTYFDRLLRYLLAITRGQEQAARDALQETFLRVARYVRPFPNEAAFWSWLTVLARSAARDGGRRQSSYWRLLADYASSWRTRSSYPDEAANDERLDHDLPRRLEQTLPQLHPLDRILVEGKYLRGTPVKILALNHGLTEKAVESRLARARRQLREALWKEWNHEA